MVFCCKILQFLSYYTLCMYIIVSITQLECMYNNNRRWYQCRTGHMWIWGIREGSFAWVGQKWEDLNGLFKKSYSETESFASFKSHCLLNVSHSPFHSSKQDTERQFLRGLMTYHLKNFFFGLHTWNSRISFNSNSFGNTVEPSIFIIWKNMAAFEMIESFQNYESYFGGTWYSVSIVISSSEKIQGSNERSPAM